MSCIAERRSFLVYGGLVRFLRLTNFEKIEIIFIFGRMPKHSCTANFKHKVYEFIVFHVFVYLCVCVLVAIDNSHLAISTIRRLIQALNMYTYERNAY